MVKRMPCLNSWMPNTKSKNGRRRIQDDWQRIADEARLLHHRVQSIPHQHANPTSRPKPAILVCSEDRMPLGLGTWETEACECTLELKRCHHSNHQHYLHRSRTECCYDLSVLFTSKSDPSEKTLTAPKFSSNAETESYLGQTKSDAGCPSTRASDTAVT